MKEIESQFEEYVRWCKDVRRMSPQTLHAKKWTYRNFIEESGLERIEQISNQTINLWIMNQTNRGCSGRTTNIRLSYLVASIRYFHDMGIATPELKLRLVAKAKEVPPKRIYYSEDQIRKVLSFADRQEWLLISLCYDCGLRISELRSLRLLNIDGQMVRFIGKGSKSRESYMSLQTRQKLDDWIAREKVSDYLWASGGSNGEPISVEEIRYLMRKPFKKAGFVDFHPHALRHSFATSICDNGASVAVAQKMLGHNSLVTTERYVHSFDGHLKEYFNQYKFSVA